MPVIYDNIEQHLIDALMQRNLWPQLSDLLNTVTVVDPACGSGSFLVGMLQVLDDLVARADAQLGREHTPYERRKRIIGHSLYGVDVMDWAVHVAELRLWLQLVIETELAQAELKFRPLLPNLSFKVRPGDSLVQEVGGINLALRQGSRLIPPQVKGRITRLKGEKLKFYNNDPRCAYTSAAQLRQAEVALFRDILDARTQAIDRRLRAIDDALRPQVNLFGEEQTTQMALDRVGLEHEREQLTRDRAQVTRAREVLRPSSRDFQIAHQATIPFVWDIAFVEVFEDERAGFDIVIGNPPYVRQEAIHDPRTPPDEVTRASKRAYKGKLARAVYAAWPRTFGYDLVKDKPRWKLAARSDLYIYFYLHGLSLLNDRGSFCFITSNAWLDVGYGADLQQFLLTRGQVKLVLDNQVRRSFASADVNTVIVLLGPAHDAKSARQASLRHTARFVMLSVPFEDVLTPTIWEEVARATTRQTTSDYRVFPLTQADLLENGMDEKQRFSGDKWGGKYLRAPDIYWVIMEKACDKLVRLGDIADVRRGFTTGANAFFYLDEETIAQWGIEEEFLAPVIKSSRECDHVWLGKIDQVSDLSLFVCHKTREALEDTNALEYIKAGEARKYHKRPSCRGRSPWWDLGEREGAKVNCNYLIGKVMRFFASDRPFFVSDNFQEVHSEIDAECLSAACNSTIAQLNINVIGRSNFGDGLLKIQTYEVSDIVIPDPRLLSLSEVRQVIVNAQMLDLIDTDRRALDAIVFDMLGLTQGERDAVYEAVVTMVEARLHKAQSLR